MYAVKYTLGGSRRQDTSDTSVAPASCLVRPFALSLVFVEASVGLLLLLGLRTWWALLAGSLMMACLIFGTALQSDWNTLAIQVLYASIYIALIAARQYNAYSVDALIQRQAIG